MSTASGITASPALLEDYANAIDDSNVRFLMIAIENGELATATMPVLPALMGPDQSL